MASLLGVIISAEVVHVYRKIKMPSLLKGVRLFTSKHIHLLKNVIMQKQPKVETQLIQAEDISVGSYCKVKGQWYVVNAVFPCAQGDVLKIYYSHQPSGARYDVLYHAGDGMEVAVRDVQKMQALQAERPQLIDKQAVAEFKAITDSKVKQTKK